MVVNLLLEKSRINISDLWSIFHIHRIGQFRNTKNMLDISSDAVIHREKGRKKKREQQYRDKKVKSTKALIERREREERGRQ